MTVRAHYDGKVIVPDEPVDLPVNAPLELEVKPVNGGMSSPALSDAQIQTRLAALERIISRGVTGTNIPDELLRREHLYDDRQ